jgi:hypothetical protein
VGLFCVLFAFGKLFFKVVGCNSNTNKNNHFDLKECTKWYDFDSTLYVHKNKNGFWNRNENGFWNHKENGFWDHNFLETNI